MYRSLVNIIKVILYFLRTVKRSLKIRSTYKKENRHEKEHKIVNPSEVNSNRENTKPNYRNIIYMCLFILVGILLFSYFANFRFGARNIDNCEQGSVFESRKGDSIYKYENSRSENRISSLNRSINAIEAERSKIDQTIETQVNRVRSSIEEAEASSSRSEDIFKQIRESIENF